MSEQPVPIDALVYRLGECAAEAPDESPVGANQLGSQVKDARRPAPLPGRSGRQEASRQRRGWRRLGRTVADRSVSPLGAARAASTAWITGPVERLTSGWPRQAATSAAPNPTASASARQRAWRSGDPRMGAAIRHAGELLKTDAARALQELRSDGIACLCLSIGTWTPTDAFAPRLRLRQPRQRRHPCRTEPAHGPTTSTSTPKPTSTPSSPRSATRRSPNSTGGSGSRHRADRPAVPASETLTTACPSGKGSSTLGPGGSGRGQPPGPARAGSFV